jgi:GT2 family glycosyltransferase
MKPDMSVVILNYNRKDLLKRCLDSLLPALGQDCLETIVVDNASTDGSVAMLESAYPEVRIVSETTNRSVVAYNDGVAQARGQWVLLLNNDMVFEPGFAIPLLTFVAEHPDVFAVGSRLVNPAGGVEACRNVCHWSHGWLSTATVSSLDACPSFYVGASALFSRSKYVAIGGLDEAFYPFYSEDVDLCYRAWKRGWEVYVEPHSSITHAHMATIGVSFDRRYVLSIAARNKFLVQWRNIDDPEARRLHRLLLPFNVAACAALGKVYYPEAFLSAWSQRVQAEKFRRGESSSRVLSDREIWQRCSG